MIRIPPATEQFYAAQILDGKAQQHLSAEIRIPHEIGPSHAAHGIDPTKGFFDAIAHAQTALVAVLPSGAAINVRVGFNGRYVRGELEVPGSGSLARISTCRRPCRPRAWGPYSWYDARAILVSLGSRRCHWRLSRCCGACRGC